MRTAPCIFVLFLEMQSRQIVDNATYAIVSYNWLINPHGEVIPAFYTGKKIKLRFKTII